jgi:hypothetical protein
MDLSIEAGLNLERYDSGDPFWAWRARCRFRLNLCVSKMKFFSASLTDRSNLNSGFQGCGHGVAIIFCSVEMRFAWGQTKLGVACSIA